jgi:hypothetical protein
MEVTILIRGLARVDEVEQFAERLICSCLEEMNASSTDLDKVVIADKQRFGEWIHKLQTEAQLPRSYTANAVYAAIGKTISSFRNGVYSCSIVLQDFILLGVLEAFMRSRNSSEWDQDPQFFLYVLCHELGHYKDHQIRGQHPDTPLHINREFKIRQVGQYYIEILEEETGACLHSAHRMTPRVYEQELRDTNESIRTMLNEVERDRLTYYADNTKLRQLAFSSSGAFWMILVQYAKLIASGMANPSLPERPTCVWKQGDVRLAEIIQDLCESVQVLCKKYPNWTGNSLEDFYGLWYRLAKLHGYQFVQGEIVDALYLHSYHEWTDFKGTDYGT